MRGTIAICGAAPNSSVCPSGAACATTLAAIAPPAPTRFSTTKVCLRSAASLLLVMRAITSVLPPAAKGTMTVTVLLGQSCASAPAGSSAIKAAPKAALRPVRPIIVFDMVGSLCFLMHRAGQMIDDLGTCHQVRVLLSHIEQVRRMRRDGAIADAIGHHDGAKIVAHGIDH